MCSIYITTETQTQYMVFGTSLFHNILPYIRPFVKCQCGYRISLPSPRAGKNQLPQGKIKQRSGKGTLLLHILEKSKNRNQWVLPQSQLPEQLLQEPLQLPEPGQPMHFLPLFFALYTYHPAAQTIQATIAIIIRSVIEFPYLAEGVFTFFPDLLHSRTTMATMAATAIRPGRKPAPKEPVVIRVPIWKTRKATV